MNKKTYFITGGGTGGHIYPALAVADSLSLCEDTEKIFYVGNPNNLEASILKSRNYVFLPVDSSGMPRKATISLISWCFQMIYAWIKCCHYIAKYKPDVVFGTGGYVSAPVLFAALVMKVPFVLHDCDANPGLVTRKFAPYAKSVSVAFEVAKNKLKSENCYVNGNPIRNDFQTLTKEEARTSLGLSDKLTLCIMGGSQGAKSINEACVNILKTLVEENDIQVIFQTGKKNYEDVVSHLKSIYPEYEINRNIIIKPYFDNMTEVLKASDIAVSRAGSLSISELCACGIATIFIPYPYAAADHQRKNARYMVENGAGLYLEDSETNPQALLKKIKSISQDYVYMRKIQQNALNLAKYDGVAKIVEQICSC